MLQTKQPQNLDARLVNPIIKATTEVIGTMAATEVTFIGVAAANDYRSNGDISAIIGIIGDDGEGMVALSFSYKLSKIIVSRLLGSSPDHLSSEDQCDGIGELANMISGSAKTILSQAGNSVYKLSLPTLIIGQGHEVASRPRIPYLVLEFLVEGEAFHLQVSFKSN